MPLIAPLQTTFDCYLLNNFAPTTTEKCNFISLPLTYFSVWHILHTHRIIFKQLVVLAYIPSLVMCEQQTQLIRVSKDESTKMTSF